MNDFIKISTLKKMFNSANNNLKTNDWLEIPATLKVKVVDESNNNFILSDFNAIDDTWERIYTAKSSDLNLNVGFIYTISGSIKWINGYSNFEIENIEDCREDHDDIKQDICQYIKQLPMPQKFFPKLLEKIRISVICPLKITAKSIGDFDNKLLQNYNYKFSIKYYNCNTEECTGLLQAINKVSSKNTDIFILLRGGGKSESIQGLDNSLIAEAINKIDCYRIIGVGHYTDRLLIEMLFDHVAQTPTDIANKLIEEISPSKFTQNVNHNFFFNQKNLALTISGWIVALCALILHIK